MHGCQFNCPTTVQPLSSPDRVYAGPPGGADLAMRLRANEDTDVRVVAELNNGELHIDSGYTRASGGDEGDAALGQLIISHPNVTDLQLDQRTRAFIPPEYVTKVEIRCDGKPLMTAETDISISEDPSFRFFFKPKFGGTLEARMTDSKGREFTHSFPVERS